MLAARRSRTRRLLALALLCLLLAPGTWWRETSHGPDARDILFIRSLDRTQPREWPAGLRLRGVWKLDSPNTRFGGYSALVALPEGRLATYSDRRGGGLTFAAPGVRRGGPSFRVIAPIPGFGYVTDFESATRDPASGRQWIGIETANVIARLSPRGDVEAARAPPEMRSWPVNCGAEAMLRLPDGRFIVLGERQGTLSLDPGPALLFAGDPVEGAAAVSFRFVPPRGFLATDMAGLPDGRVLILLRGLDLGVPPFRSMLVVADPAEIRAGEEWTWTPFADLSPPLPRDNYEGLAIAPTPDGGADIWVISDDNNASLQRTLLIRLHWAGEARMQKGAADRTGAPR